jgi:hypothetical protein
MSVIARTSVTRELDAGNRANAAVSTYNVNTVQMVTPSSKALLHAIKEF